MNEIRKIEVAGDESVDEYSKTFILNDEDHTLANALRYLIMKNPNVSFCGYTIPHPSETKVNFRIQTNKRETALDVLEKGLKELHDVCSHVLTTFDNEFNSYARDAPVQMKS